MKKQLTFALGLAVLATPAFATKARLEALGEDNFGSYYINDNRNIFLNAAKINENKDFVTYEFGTSTSNSTDITDAAGSPKAEGGFAKAYGNFVYGAHFGNSTPTIDSFRSKVTDGQERNPIDVFIGGDAGVKWGVDIAYENYDGSDTDGSQRISSNALRTRLGAIAGDFEAFTILSLKSDSHNRTDETQMESKSSYLFGVGQWWNNYKFFAEYTLAAAEYGTGNTNSDIEVTQYRLGAARQEKLNDKATLFAKAMLVQLDSEDDNGAGPGTKTDIQSRTLPFTIGLEYDAVSWLQLRASVVQNVWGSDERKIGSASKVKSSVANTAVRAGASLKFGEFQIDGLISTVTDNDSAAGTGGGQTYGQDTTGGNGSLRADTLMTRVSMLYCF